MPLYGSYRYFRNPDRFSLLLPNLVFQSVVPHIHTRLKINACCEGNRKKQRLPFRVHKFLKAFSEMIQAENLNPEDRL